MITETEKNYKMQISNSTNQELRLVLEPWGERYLLPAKAKFQLQILSTITGVAEVEYLDEPIVIFHAWLGSVVKVFYGDQELSPPRDIRRGF
jgi:hypothetical protein